jgi:hypothetical protein
MNLKQSLLKKNAETKGGGKRRNPRRRKGEEGRATMMDPQRKICLHLLIKWAMLLSFSSILTIVSLPFPAQEWEWSVND